MTTFYPDTVSRILGLSEDLVPRLPGVCPPGDFGLSRLVGHRLQGRGLALPGDVPALGPKDLPRADVTAGKDFDDKTLAGAKELQGYTKAEGGLETCPHG